MLKMQFYVYFFCLYVEHLNETVYKTHLELSPAEQWERALKNIPVLYESAISAISSVRSIWINVFSYWE